MASDLDLSDWPQARPVRLGSGRVIACVDRPGDGVPLVLLHGFTDHGLSYAPLLPGLAGHRLIIPDLRGHGASFRPEAYALADFTADIAALLDRLNIGRAVMVGHSLGAMVAINLAASLEGRMAGLVTLAGTLRPQGPAIAALAENIAGLVDPINPQDPLFQDWHSGAERLGDAFLHRLQDAACAMPAAVWRAVTASLHEVDLTPAARRIRVPMLVIGGAADPLFGPDHHRALLAACPDATGHLLPGCRHNPHWEQPDTVATLIRGHLAAA